MKPEGGLPQSLPRPPQGDPRAVASIESSVGPAQGREGHRGPRTQALSLQIQPRPLSKPEPLRDSWSYSQHLDRLQIPAPPLPRPHPAGSGAAGLPAKWQPDSPACRWLGGPAYRELQGGSRRLGLSERGAPEEGVGGAGRRGASHSSLSSPQASLLPGPVATRRPGHTTGCSQQPLDRAGWLLSSPG